LQPRKGTKAYDREFIRVYYGINADTLEVQSVWQQRDGLLSGPNGGTHYNLHGGTMQSEIHLVFNLIEVRMVPINVVEDMGAKIMEELKAKAAELRAEREA
jgi:hypothetical protein